MAKDNIYLGTLKGKLGDQVFWRTKGQQRVRAYFKRTDYNVGYEAALRQSQFANLKGIYQWLPEPFRKACDIYRIGGNSYADFMRQYPNFTQGRPSWGFGSGRFLPVNCAVSNGTLGDEIKGNVGVVQTHQESYNNEYTTGWTSNISEDIIDEPTIGTITYGLKKMYPWIQDGDLLHVLMAWVFFDKLPWGQASAVDGLPFAYSSKAYAVIKLDENATININRATNGVLQWATGDIGYGSLFALCPNYNMYDGNQRELYSMVGAVMIERPGNSRQKRYSPAQLVFDRSQLMILDATSRGNWNDLCARSFMKE